MNRYKVDFRVFDNHGCSSRAYFRTKFVRSVSPRYACIAVRNQYKLGIVVIMNVGVSS